MKFENLYINCESMEQRNIVIAIALKNGYNRFCSDWGDKPVVLTECGKVFDMDWPDANDNSVYGKLTYSEFSEKFKEVKLLEKIHQAKKELSLNNTELSLRMGKSKPYIAKMLNQPQSEKVQNKVIKQLDNILDTENYLKPYAEQAKKMQEDAKIMSGNTNITINNDPDIFNQLSIERHQNSIKDKEIADLKKTIESKDLAISGLIKQNDEAKKIHDKDVKALVEKDDQFMVLAESMEQVERERDYFVNQCHKLDHDNVSLKAKIKRERWIIIIVIAILTGLFFLKGAIGG